MIKESVVYKAAYKWHGGDGLSKPTDSFIAGVRWAETYLQKRSSKRRRVSPKAGKSNVRKADVARSAKR